MTCTYAVTRVSGERGDIVLGWLTRLAAVLGVLGLVAFDGIAVAQAHFQAADRATTAAAAAAEEYKRSNDVQLAYNAALATAGANDTIETSTFTVATNGTVKLRLHHVATTLVLHRIGPLKDWADAAEDGEGRPGT